MNASKNKINVDLLNFDFNEEDDELGKFVDVQEAKQDKNGLTGDEVQMLLYPNQ